MFCGTFNSFCEIKADKITVLRKAICLFSFCEGFDVHKVGKTNLCNFKGWKFFMFTNIFVRKFIVLYFYISIELN